jgi:hypothetical protein
LYLISSTFWSRTTWTFHCESQAFEKNKGIFLFSNKRIPITFIFRPYLLPCSNVIITLFFLMATPSFSKRFWWTIKFWFKHFTFIFFYIGHTVWHADLSNEHNMFLNFPRSLSILLLQTSKTDNNALDIDATYNLKLRKT